MSSDLLAALVVAVGVAVAAISAAARRGPRVVDDAEPDPLLDADVISVESDQYGTTIRRRPSESPEVVIYEGAYVFSPIFNDSWPWRPWLNESTGKWYKPTRHQRWSSSDGEKVRCYGREIPDPR